MQHCRPTRVAPSRVLKRNSFSCSAGSRHGLDAAAGVVVAVVGADGHCCIWSTGGMPKPLLTKASDRQSKLVERGGNLKACWLLNRELVVAAPKVLHQGMPGQHDRGTAVLFEPAHRPEPRLQPPV